jgi:hypothetical protein
MVIGQLIFIILVHVTTYRRDREAEDDQKGEIIYIKQVRMSFIMNALSLRSLHHKKSKILFYFLSRIKMTHNVQISLYHNDD